METENENKENKKAVFVSGAFLGIALLAMILVSASVSAQYRVGATSASGAASGAAASSSPNILNGSSGIGNTGTLPDTGVLPTISVSSSGSGATGTFPAAGAAPTSAGSPNISGAPVSGGRFYYRQPELRVSASGSVLIHGMIVTSVNGGTITGTAWGITYTVESLFHSTLLLRGGGNASAPPAGHIAAGDELGVAGKVTPSDPLVIQASLVRDYSITALRSPIPLAPNTGVSGALDRQSLENVLRDLTSRIRILEDRAGSLSQPAATGNVSTSANTSPSSALTAPSATSVITPAFPATVSSGALSPASSLATSPLIINSAAATIPAIPATATGASSSPTSTASTSAASSTVISGTSTALSSMAATTSTNIPYSSPIPTY